MVGIILTMIMLILVLGLIMQLVSMEVVLLVRPLMFLKGRMLY